VRRERLAGRPQRNLSGRGALLDPASPSNSPRLAPPARSLPPDLRDAVAARFTPFSYPPASTLYERGCTCDEAFVLLSGSALLHVEGRPPQVRTSAEAAPAL
jgi:hypothetical protein